MPMQNLVGKQRVFFKTMRSGTCAIKSSQLLAKQGGPSWQMPSRQNIQKKRGR